MRNLEVWNWTRGYRRRTRGSKDRQKYNELAQFIHLETNSKNCYSKQLKTPEEKYLAFRDCWDDCDKTNVT